MTLAPSVLFPSAAVPTAIDLASLVLWQALLGLAIGMIYSGSLYFGKPGALQHQAGCLSQAIGLWALAPLLHKEA